MDKAEKIKAARKKLKEFQSHKKQDGVEEVQAEKVDESAKFDEAPEPIISSYFDSLGTETSFVTSPSETQHLFSTPLPPTATAAPIPTPASIPAQNDYQQGFFQSFASSGLGIGDVLHCLEDVKSTFRNQPQVIDEFLNILREFQAGNSDTSTVVQKVSYLFREHPDLIAKCSSFIPSGYKPEAQAPAVDVQMTTQPIMTPMEMQTNSIPQNNDKLRELQEQINQQNVQISQLKSEVEFHRTTATNLQKNTDELNRLKQREQQHADAIKVLVTEKSNLTDAYHRSENVIATLKGENEELHNRLNLSRHRVKQLESTAGAEVTTTTTKVDTLKIEEMVQERIREMRGALEVVENERNELKMLLNQRRIEMENLQKNYDHLNTELHMQSIKIAQLSDGSQPESDVPATQSQIAVLTQDSAIKQQQISELNSIIDQLNREKEASETQYQNYVSAITREMEIMKENSLELSNENDGLVKREQELLKHVSDLERQMQQQIQKQKTYAESHQSEREESGHQGEEVLKLTSQVNALLAENETYKSQLTLHETDKIELNKKLASATEEINNLQFQMERIKTETPNVSQLMVDFEDKSTAASRALSQNQSLKFQLEELQRAFVNISNDKMELTDKLQSEMHLGKEMKSRYDAMEEELSSVKDKWQFKEDEMIRLSHSNTELEKKILQQNIEIDRLRHYESKDYHRGEGGVIEKELENCRHLIESLTNKINVLESGKEHVHQEEGHSHNHDGHSHSHEGHSHNHEHTHDAKCEHKHEHPSNKDLLNEIEMLKMEKSELLKAINDFRRSKTTEEEEVPKVEETLVNGDVPEEMTDEKLRQLTIPKSVTPSMATEEALEKLQERFRRTMLEVADLTEEKIRLEHVVTQLQFETETIGEYITLYQNQRRQLKQKEHERDIQLKSLAADREMMNKKLLQLNGLIEKFVLQHTDQSQIEVAKEATKLLENEGVTGAEPLIISGIENDYEKLKKETAGKILEILSDIKTTNTKNYDSNINVENSCSCCLGRLETV